MSIDLIHSISHIQFGCRLAESVILCYGPLNHTLSKDDKITVDAFTTEKPYLGTKIHHDKGENMLLALFVNGVHTQNTLSEVMIRNDQEFVRWSPVEVCDLNQGTENFVQFLSTLDNKAIKKLSYLLSQLIVAKPDIANDPILKKVGSTIHATMACTEDL